MSAALTAKAGLLTVLAAALAADGCPVLWGVPDYLLDDMVILLGVNGSAQLGAMGPNRGRDESLTLTVTVSCFRGGSDQRVVTERAWGLFALIEDAVRADPTLDGSVVTASAAGWDMEEGLSLGEGDTVLGRVCEIIIRIEATARY